MPNNPNMDQADIKRATSGISSPYFDLDASIKVADVIYKNGGGTCTSDQLCHWLNYKTIKSGTYLMRVAAAKSFGLINTNGGRVHTTERALLIIAPVMSGDIAKGKAEAFLSVDLFNKIYEKFKGQTLPSEDGMKNLLKGTPFFMLPDRSGPALRVFFNSAEQSGFLTPDRSKLIIPVYDNNTQSNPDSKAQIDTPAVTDKPKTPLNTESASSVHSAIIGLLRELPPPGPWPEQKKQRFLSAFKATIDFIYPEED